MICVCMKVFYIYVRHGLQTLQIPNSTTQFHNSFHVIRHTVVNFHLFFESGRLYSQARCFWTRVLLADQQGIEPPPAVCHRHKSDAIPTEPRGRLWAWSAQLLQVLLLEIILWVFGSSRLGGNFRRFKISWYHSTERVNFEFLCSYPGCLW